MSYSAFDLFRIGLGPSSSHTVGPMRASRRFVLALRDCGRIDAAARVRCDLYGSLGATGRGHGSDKAVMLGLQGEQPDLVNPRTVEARLAMIRESGTLRLLGQRAIAFDERTDLLFHRHAVIGAHANGMRLSAFDAQGGVLLAQAYYSVGGGAVVREDEVGAPMRAHDATPRHPSDVAPDATSGPFSTGRGLLQRCAESGVSIAQVMWRHELESRTAQEVREGLLRIWDAMRACTRRGLAAQGVLPGALALKRRAPALHGSLACERGATSNDPLRMIDWVGVHALAVSEENAAGGRVVTAPTNGAAGIVPAVLHYYQALTGETSEQAVIEFLLTAAAIGTLYQRNASISGAMVGCQGEVGVACSMAAGALTAVLGGTPAQVENAAEIGMEHHLGLTCDPIGGLVQIPCIERNAIGAVKAITAARMALRGDGTHHVSLDQVIRVMRETGADMNPKYKETAHGGLAMPFVEC